MIYSYVLLLFLLVLELKGYDGLEIVKVNTLDAHTAFRKRHGVPPLKISSKKGHGGLEIVKVNTLDAHNAFRKKHDVPPLKISSKLNKVSQDWANYLAKIDQMKHRPKSGYGENIFMIRSSQKITQLGTKAVNAWYSEVKYFDFKGSEKRMSSSSKAFHFTQVVWKNSKELGQGAAKSKSGNIYVVCNYNPPGNVIGHFKQNVFPRRK